jgi:hypothetical protein
VLCYFLQFRDICVVLFSSISDMFVVLFPSISRYVCCVIFLNFEICVLCYLLQFLELVLPVLLISHIVNDFEMVQIALLIIIITGVTAAIIFILFFQYSSKKLHYYGLSEYSRLRSRTFSFPLIFEYLCFLMFALYGHVETLVTVQKLVVLFFPLCTLHTSLSCLASAKMIFLFEWTFYLINIVLTHF